MKAPPTPSGTKAQEEWLQDCGFQSRQDHLGHSVAPGILSQKIERHTAETMVAPTHVLEELHLPGRDIFPLIELEPPTEKEKAGHTQKEKANAEVASELRSFRKLSTAVFCPETKREAYPEYILFGLIVLLAMLWPILAMFGVMARHH